MKRRLITIAIFVLAGAVVNVAVAWGVAAVAIPNGRVIAFVADRHDILHPQQRR